MEIIMTKNYVHGSLSDATIMAEKSTSRKRKRTDCWPDSGYFKQDCNKFSLVKANANIPEMTLFYLNNASLYASKMMTLIFMLKTTLLLKSYLSLIRQLI